MSARLDGGRSWRPAAATAFVLPAVIVLLGLAGVTSGPLLDVRQARARHLAAEGLLGEYRAEQGRLEALRRGVDLERVDELAAQLDELLPVFMQPMDVHALLRLAARAVGLNLASIELGTLYDLVAEIDGQTVYMQDVRVSADDELIDLVRFVQALRERGYPTVVQGLVLSRAASRGASFHIQLHLGLLHRGAPPLRSRRAAGAATPDAEGRDPDAQSR